MDLVDALNVLKNLDGVSEILCRADGVHDVNTGGLWERQLWL